MSGYTKKIRGYSLVEVLIAITIAGILATIIAQSYYRYLVKTRVASMLVAAAPVQKEFENYLLQGPPLTCDATYITGTLNPANVITNLYNPSPYISQIIFNHNCVIEIYGVTAAIAPNVSSVSGSYISLVLCPILGGANKDQVTWVCLFYDSTSASSTSAWLPFLPSNCQGYWYTGPNLYQPLCGH